MRVAELAAFFTPDLQNKQTSTMATSTTSTEPTQLQNYRPSMSTDTVHKLVRDLYGLRVLTCRELDSYDDRNFHVQVDGSREAVRNEHLPEEVWPHGYVLKVLNSLDSKKPEVIEAKNIMTLAAADNGFPTPRPVPSVSGQLFVLHPLVREQDDQADTGVEERKRSEIFLIRLMEYLPGAILASVPLTSDLSFQIGQYAAQLDRVLKDVDDSQFPELLVNWNMQNVPSLRRLTCYIDDAKMVSVVTEVIDAFESRVLKSEDGRLQTGLIHSDFNDHNILVEPVEGGGDGDGDPTPASSSVHRVCGILDFGDSTKTFLLVEIAIAMAYLILQCSPELDPDEMAGHALAGYLSELTLNPAELDLLPLTICARLSHTLTFGFHRRVLDPCNEYCLVHARKVGVHLHRLWSRPAGDTLALWRGVARGRGVTV